MQAHGPNPRRPWRRRIAVASVLLLSLGLRLVHLQTEAIYSDEAFSWRVATRPLPVFLRQVAEDTHPVLHFAVLKGVMMLCEPSPMALRLPSVATGVGAVYFTYLLCLELIIWGRARDLGCGWPAALTAATLVAIHPLHVEFSRTARMYALAAFLATAAAWLLVRSLRARRWAAGWWGLYGLCLAMLLHTHNFGLLTFGAHVLFFLSYCWQRPLERRQQRSMIVALGGAMLGYLPWLPVLLNQAARVRADFWIQPLSWHSLSDALNSWLFGLPSGGLTLFVVGVAIFAVLLVFAGLHRSELAVQFSSLQLALPWLATLLVSLWGERPVLQDRYLICATVGFSGLLALFLHEITVPLVRGILLTNLLLPTAYAAIAFLATLPTAAPAVLQVCSDLRRNSTPGDLIIVPDAADVNILSYYCERWRGGLMPICCPRPEPRRPGGHVNHAAALLPQESVDLPLAPSPAVRRVWTVNSAWNPPPTLWQEAAMTYYPPTHRAYPHGCQVTLFEAAQSKLRSGVTP